MTATRTKTDTAERADDEKPCRICSDPEPHHVHNGDERIEDYFTVGRGQTDFQAALSWQEKYQRAVRERPAETDKLTLDQFAGFVTQSAPLEVVVTETMRGWTTRDREVQVRRTEGPGELHVATATVKVDPVSGEERVVRVLVGKGVPWDLAQPIVSAIRLTGTSLE